MHVSASSSKCMHVSRQSAPRTPTRRNCMRTCTAGASMCSFQSQPAGAKHLQLPTTAQRVQHLLQNRLEASAAWC